jgi:hypothetical protein
MKHGHLLQIMAVGAMLGCAPFASAQPPQQPPAGGPPAQGRGGPPPPMTNLQVLPKDMPRPEVITRMQGFRQGLGVECAYCHIDEGRGGRTDYASDEKPPKATARVMMRLTEEVNTKLASGLGKASPVTVGCITCHRGVPIPKQLPAILTETASAKGTPAAIAEYRELRTKFYGGMAYDFSEGALINFGGAAAATKPDDAIQWLQLNLEFYPKSVRTYLSMAQIYSRKPDKDNAIKSVEKALEIEPENAQAKRLLDQLKSGH